MLLNLTQSPQISQDRVRRYLNTLKEVQYNIAGEVLKYICNHPTATPYQTKMSEDLECNRSYLNEILWRFHKDGFLKLTKRRRKESLIYKLSPNIAKPDILKVLSEFFPFLKWINIKLLISSTFQLEIQPTLLEKSLFINSPLLPKEQKEEEIKPKKIYKDVLPITNRKPPDIKVDNVNKNELLNKIQDRQTLVGVLEVAYQKSGHWKTGEMLEKAKRELKELNEQFIGTNKERA